MTAVEWLATYLKGITSLNCDEVIEQAKEMERNQILDAFEEGSSDGYDGWGSSNKEKYYNETYKQ